MRKKKQKTKFELSAGGIVFCPQTKKILVIEDKKGRVGLPKGWVEKGEKLVETAKRETSEETGIKNLQTVKKIGEINFFYRRNKNLIFKKVVYFLFETSKQKPKPQKEEIENAYWVKKEEFTKILSYDNLKPLAQKALRIINSFYGKKS
ncbi:NUDIX domain-containing protein [bacterium]|nr:NUDIX domain-containing protein [bacterium]